MGDLIEVVVDNIVPCLVIYWGTYLLALNCGFLEMFVFDLDFNENPNPLDSRRMLFLK